MEEIKSILWKILKNIEAKQQEEDNFKKYWEESVTKKISKHAKVTFFKKGELFVNVENPTWLCELKSNKETILEKIKKISKGKIKSIRFKVGAIYGKKE